MINISIGMACALAGVLAYIAAFLFTHVLAYAVAAGLVVLAAAIFLAMRARGSRGGTESM
jgi:hypothetical protein